MSCIIPVRPEFQDPPDAPTAVPYPSSIQPPAGTLVFIGSGTAHFEVVVTDSDPTVTLYYQWVFDYPPYTTTTRLGPSGMKAVSANGTGFPWDLGCLEINPASGASSPVSFELLIADQPFIDSSDPNHKLDTIADPTRGHVIPIPWLVVMPCMVGP